MKRKPNTERRYDFARTISFSPKGWTGLLKHENIGNEPTVALLILVVLGINLW